MPAKAVTPKFKPTSLPADDRKLIARAVKDINDAAAELASIKPGSETPEADLDRVRHIHKQVFDATQVLRSEAAWLRATAIKNAITHRIPREVIGDMLGGINRFRVREIIAKTKKPTYEGTKITDRAHLAAKRAETDAAKVAATNGTASAPKATRAKAKAA